MASLKTKSAWWLLVPAVGLLVALTVWANLQPAPLRGAPPAFQLVAERVEFTRTWNRVINHPETHCYRLKIFINHVGPRPAWWGQTDGMTTFNNDPHESYRYSAKSPIAQASNPSLNPHFVSVTGQSYRWPVVENSYDLFDAPSQCYMVRGVACVNQSFDIEHSRFVTTLKTKFGVLKVDAPVKFSGPKSFPVKP